MSVMTSLTTRRRTNPWPWFCVYLTLGAFGALSVVSLGWVLLGPLVLLVGVSLFSANARRGSPGLAVGAGLVFGYFAASGDGRTYGQLLMVIAIGLLVAGVLEQVRRTWFAHQ